MRVRTGYSFRIAVGTLQNVYDRLSELEWGFYPITDQASCFGFNRWRKICEKNGVKPVFGVELLVSSNISAKKPVGDAWLFIAKDSLRPIHELIEIATDQFRYTPLLTYKQALDADAFKIMGHRTTINELPDGFERTPDLFFGLSPSLTTGQFNRYKERGIKPVAVSDNRYPRKGDNEFYEVIAGREVSTQTYPQYLMEDTDWGNYMMMKIRTCNDSDLKKAIANRQMIGEASNAKLIKGQLPHIDWPKTLEEQCQEGAKELGVNLDDPVYKARFEREMELIHTKGFDDYFQIVGDMVRYAKKVMVVGPARGSSCGSLVCYLLKITTVDPIPHKLVFERFIDINRDDLPDIDIDFSDEKRHLAFEYLSSKYGEDHMARLGTVSTYKPRMAINEAGAALKIPKWETEAALDGLIERSSGDARALDTLEDTLRETPKGLKLLTDHPEIIIATQMEGHPRHSGQHAAGIILTQQPILEHVAVDSRKVSSQCDKKDAEDLDLLKIDALGLSQLSVFEHAMDLIGMKYQDLYELPLDDKLAFEILNRGHYSGIFQFNGRALKTLTEQVIVTEFDDLASISALARPGPLVSGGAQEWVDRKNGTNPITYPHEMFRPYIEDTYGVIVYQEQIMSIGREVGKMSWTDVTMLRKAMSKSLGKEFFDQYGDKFKAGAVENGVPFGVAAEVWEGMCDYGSWAFNKSHSVAYGLISYYCCWLKAHYPLEFAAGTLSHEKDPDRQIQLLRELQEEGITYDAVDPDISTDKWTVGSKGNSKKLVGPLSTVKGIGPKLMGQIIDARRGQGEMPKRAVALLNGAKTSIDSLYPVSDRIKQICPNLRDMNIVTTPTTIGSITEEHKYDMHNVLIIGRAMKINPRNENETIKIAKRGFVRPETEPLDSLNLTMEDDTGQIFCHISRFNYDILAKEIVDRGRPTRSIYVLKGKLIAKRRFMIVDRVRYFGDMDPEYTEEKIAAE